MFKPNSGFVTLINKINISSYLSLYKIQFTVYIINKFSQ